jgi:hypothetical protein
MTAKRFRLDTGCVIDMQENKVLTDKQATNLLNGLHEELEPIKKICKKYRIPIKDLPEILEEYIAYDNDDEW